MACSGAMGAAKMISMTQLDTHAATAHKPLLYLQFILARRAAAITANDARHADT